MPLSIVLPRFHGEVDRRELIGGLAQRAVAMAKGARHPRRPPTLILVALLTISVVLLVLLALGAFSLPAVSEDGRVAEVHRSVREAYGRIARYDFVLCVGRSEGFLSHCSS